MTTAYLNRIATAVPAHGVHDAFVVFAGRMLADPSLRAVFRRMASRANIAHRFSFFDTQKYSGQFSSHDAHDLERSEWNCRLFGWVERIAGWHRFVRHDGPVSFRRAFREEDWVGYSLRLGPQEFLCRLSTGGRTVVCRAVEGSSVVVIELGQAAWLARAGVDCG